jgi:hypothetical protein
MTEQDILDLIEKDEWMMKVLRTASELNLPDWMIGAGFVRNKVWDYLHGYTSIHDTTSDIDLIYFNVEDKKEETEKKYDRLLKEKMDVNWSVKNQARMFSINNTEPYISSEDAISNWVETATAIAVKLQDNKLILIAPHGISDLVNLIIRPVPLFKNNTERIVERAEKKQWLKKWPKLKFILD